MRKAVFIVGALVLLSLCGCEALRDALTPYRDEVLFKRQTDQGPLQEK